MPTKDEPIEDESIGLVLTGCPLDYVTDDIWTAIDYAELYEKGLPPIAGGALDQAQIFLDACKLILAEKAYWKKRLKIL